MRNPRKSISTGAQGGLETPLVGGDRDALAIFIQRREWERVALLLLIAVARITAAAPPGSIDDLLAALDDEEKGTDA